MKKTYIIDTNVLIHDPEAIFKFEDNDVVIPIHVLEEVDQFKRESTERGRNSRHVCRIIDELRTSGGSLKDGVDLGPKKGKLFVFMPTDKQVPRPGPEHGSMDRAIIKSALLISKTKRWTPAVFITMDINLRLMADGIGLQAENYENSKADVVLSTSVREVQADSATVDDFFRSGKISKAREFLGFQFHPNESVQIIGDDSKHTALARYDESKDSLVQLRFPKEGVYGVKPKNREQAFAFDLLLDDSVQLVSLVGKAGTGKTLLAIAAGLKKVVEDGVYVKMLVSRPVMPMGRDIGFLPGDVSEKLNPWMQPIFDNLEFLTSKGKERGEDAYQKLLESGIIQVEPLTYIRGRSLPCQYMIVDEAQNLTPHEIKTIVTRAGEGSKIVLTGDPDQIDNPYVDSVSNGLSVVMEKFMEQSVAGRAVLTKGERSALAELATLLL